MAGSDVDGAPINTSTGQSSGSSGGWGVDSGGGDINPSNSSASGDTSGRAYTGNKTFNIGGNPNIAQGTQAIGQILSNPFMWGAVAIVGLVYVLKRRG